MAVVYAELSLSNSPRVALISITVDTLFFVIRLAIVVTSNARVITFLTLLGRIPI